MQHTVRLDREADWFNALPGQMGDDSYQQLTQESRAPRPGDRSVWMCPRAGGSSAAIFFAYGMNMRLSTWEGVQPDRIDGVGPISIQVFMAEGPGPHCSLLPSDRSYSPIAPHRGSSTIAFLDGHVSVFAGAALGYGIGDPRRPDVMWRVPNSPWAGPPR